MPARPEGVYADSRGQWYFKVSLGKDGLTGRREQITRREPSGSRFRAGSWLSIRSCTRQDRRPGVRSRAIGAPSRPESSSP